MVSKPEQWIEDFGKAGASMFTFHLEAVVSDWSGSDPLSSDSVEAVKKIIEKIRAAGMKVGISVKPKTAIEKVFPLVKLLDMVLVMTVEPGFGGQAFMPECMEKVNRANP